MMQHISLKFNKIYSIKVGPEEQEEPGLEIDSWEVFYQQLNLIKNKYQYKQCSDPDLDYYLNNDPVDQFLIQFGVNKAVVNQKKNHGVKIELNENFLFASNSLSRDAERLKLCYIKDFILVENYFLSSASLNLLRFLLYQKLIYFANVYKSEFGKYINSVRPEILPLIEDFDFWLLFAKKLSLNPIKQTESYQYKDNHFFSNFILKQIYQILLDSEYHRDLSELKGSKRLSIQINEGFPVLDSKLVFNEFHVLEKDDCFFVVLHSFTDQITDQYQTVNNILDFESLLKSIQASMFAVKSDIDRYIEKSLFHYDKISDHNFIYSDQLKWYYINGQFHKDISIHSVNDFHYFPAFLFREKDKLTTFLSTLPESFKDIKKIRFHSSVILSFFQISELDLVRKLSIHNREIEIQHFIEKEKVDISMFLSMDFEEMQLAEKQGKVYRLKDNFKSKVLEYRKLAEVSGMEQGRIQLYQYPYLQNIFATDKLESKFRREIDLYFDEFLKAQDTELNVDSNYGLYSFQKKSLNWLDSLYVNGLNGILADDMGLGKTKQISAFIKYKQLDSVLILSPKSIISNWLTELNNIGLSDLAAIAHPDYPILYSKKIYISSYQSFKKYDFIIKKNFNLIVFDEIQVLKNDRSQLHKDVKILKSNMKIGLSGTPLENSLMDLWAVFDIVEPGFLGDKKRFKKNFVTQYKRYLDMGSVYEAKERKNILKAAVTPFMLRRRKNDPVVFNDLPKKQEHNVICELTREQEQIYRQLIFDYNQSIKDNRTNRLYHDKQLMITLFLRLKQLCNHAAFIDKNNHRIKERSGKLAELEVLIEKILVKKEKLIIFSQFKESCELLADYISKKYKILLINGEVQLDERSRIVKSFQDSDDFPILIMSLKTGGLGLNLTAANHVIHFDRWWNPAVEEQASDRVYRIGQKKDVHIYRFLTRATIEESIQVLIDSKKKLFNDFIEDRSFLENFSREELLKVLKIN